MRLTYRAAGLLIKRDVGVWAQRYDWQRAGRGGNASRKIQISLVHNVDMGVGGTQVVVRVAAGPGKANTRRGQISWIHWTSRGLEEEAS